jgi:hypothetical protein
MNSINVEVSWRILESGRGKPWSFPAAVSPYMKKHYGGPAIYRWIAQGTEPLIRWDYCRNRSRLLPLDCAEPMDD